MYFNTFVIFGIITLIILLYLHLTRRFNYWKNRNVSYIKPIPLFGNVLSICMQKQSIDSYLRTLYNSTTLPFFGFFVFDQPFILIRDPELVKDVLVSSFDHFCDRSLMENKNDKSASKTLFMMKQPKWSTVRAKVTPLFSSAKLKSMIPLVFENADDMVKHINDTCLNTESVNCKNITVKYAIDVISSIIFGLKVNSYQNSEFAAATYGIQGTSLSRLFQLSAHFFAPFLVKLFNLKFNDCKSVEYVKKIVVDTIRDRENKKISRPDLIDIIIQIKKQDPVLFDDDQVMALSIQYLVAGFETSGATVAFALYELSLNTSIQDRLRNEILSVVEKHEIITYEVIKKMTYLDMLIKETLRKYPTLPFLDRRCTKTYKIPNSDIIIEKGIPIYISVIGLQSDEQYFPDPQNFDPERFLPENKYSITPYTYMPFGEGHRNCLGATFGTLSVCVALIKILTNFEVSMSKDTPTALTFENSGFLMVPKNDEIFIKFNKIKSNLK